MKLRARCAIACTVRFGAKLQTAPKGHKRAKTLLARKVLRRAKAIKLRAGARRHRAPAPDTARGPSCGRRAARQARAQPLGHRPRHVRARTAGRERRLRVVLTAKVRVSRGISPSPVNSACASTKPGRAAG